MRATPAARDSTTTTTGALTVELGLFPAVDGHGDNPPASSPHGLLPSAYSAQWAIIMGATHYYPAIFSRLLPRNPALFIDTQYFFHLPSLGQLVDQLVQIPDLLNQWVFQLFHSVATNDALNEMRVRV